MSRTPDNTQMPDWFRSKRSRTTSSSSSRFDDPHQRGPWPALALASVAAAATAYAGYELHRSVQNHGWEGTLRYIWEGDPYDPDLREAVDKLEDAEWDLAATIDDRLSGLEASLDAATAAATAAPGEPIVRLWNEAWMEHPSRSITPLTVERTLADTSDRLDKIAAKVDGVIVGASSSSSFLTQRVKKRKKLLSKTIVSNMERCDALVASFHTLREEAKSLLTFVL
eukprot:jgi/Psemu1/296337/fgenesh1_pm.145_\